MAYNNLIDLDRLDRFLTKVKSLIVPQNLWYGTCSTAAGTAAKIVTTSSGDFERKTGAMVRVMFTNANSYNGTATLNVDGTGAVNITRVGATATTRYYWTAGEVVDFVYDGSNYVMSNKGTATTSYYGLTKLSSSTSSTSTSLAATPKAVSDALSLAQSYADDKSVLYIVGSDPNGDGHFSATDGTTYAMLVSALSDNREIVIECDSLIYRCISHVGVNSAEFAYTQFTAYYTITIDCYEQTGAISNETLTYNDDYIPDSTSDLTNDSGFVTSSDIPVTSVNSMTGDVSLTYSDVGAAAVPACRAVTLTASGWSNKTQTVTVTGVSADETAQLITVTPAAASLSVYKACAVMATAQAANSITFSCTDTPTSNLTIYVTIQGVSYAS